MLFASFLDASPLEWTLRGTLLLLAAALAGRFLASAASRHLAWGLGLASLLTIPLVTATVPEVDLPLLPAATPVVATSSPRELPATSPAPLAIHRAPEETPPDTVSRRETGASSLPPAPGERGGAVTWLTMLWWSGTLVLLAWLLLDLKRRRDLQTGARELGDPAWAASLREEAPRRAERARLLVSEGVSVPVTWGLWRPVLLLPPSALTWSSRARHNVLAHELAHARRGDAAWKVLARLACALHWPNPLVWWAASRLEAESELACDDRVLARGARPSGYAGDLLEIARRLATGVEPAAAMADRRTGLSARIAAILDEDRVRRAPTRGGVTTAIALTVGLVVPGVTLFGLERRSPQPPLAASFLDSTRSLGSNGATSGSDPGQAPPVPPRPGAPPSPAVPVDPVAYAPGPAPPVPPAPALGGMNDADCGRIRSSNTKGKDDRLRVTIKAERCRLEVDVEGEVEFNAAEDAIARMGSGARLEIKERRGGERRRLLAESDASGGALLRWWIDGDELPFDERGRTWLAGLLPRLFRSTGWDAGGRVPRILARAGVDGVFREIRLIPGDYVTRLYLNELMEATPLSPAQLERWTRTAGQRLGSDYELAKALSLLPPAALDTPAVQGAFIHATATMGSDYELRRTLATLLSREDLSSGVLDSILAAAGTIDSDYEAAQLLLGIVRAYPTGEILPADFFTVAARIGSDYELRRTLQQAAGRRLGNDELRLLLDTAAAIDSDYELAELLVAVAQNHRIEGPVRDAFQRAMSALGSDYEHDRVAKALARS